MRETQSGPSAHSVAGLSPGSGFGLVGPDTSELELTRFCWTDDWGRHVLVPVDGGSALSHGLCCKEPLVLAT